MFSGNKNIFRSGNKSSRNQHLKPFINPIIANNAINSQILYSLRLLNPFYTGPCIRVRRSSDNAEMDIGYISNSLNIVALMSFVGSGSGYIKIWYDSSGKGIHASQATAANQPQIISSGALITKNSKPSIHFASNNFLNATPSITSNQLSLFMAISMDSGTQTTGGFISAGASGYDDVSYPSGFLFQRDNTLNTYISLIRAGNETASISTTYGQLFIASLDFSSAVMNMQVNSKITSDTASTGAFNINSFRIGKVFYQDSNYFVGNISEIIVWNSDMSPLRAYYHNNAKTYYSTP